MNTEPVNKCGLKREDFQTTVQGKKTDLFVLRKSGQRGCCDELRWCCCSYYDARQGRQLCQPRSGSRQHPGRHQFT